MRPEEPSGADYPTDVALTRALELIRRVAAERRLARVHGNDAILQVLPSPSQGPHGLRDAADSDALISLAEGERAYAKGDVVEAIAY